MDFQCKEQHPGLFAAIPAVNPRKQRGLSPTQDQKP